jgi:hypothetical protein
VWAGLFRALADQFYGTPDKHRLVRSTVCDYLHDNAPTYELFVGSHADDSISASDAFQRHVAGMRMLGTYGSHLEIQAWAKLTGCKINIIQPGLVYVVDGDTEIPSSPDTSSESESSSSTSEDDDYVHVEEDPPLSERDLRHRNREARKASMSKSQHATPSKEKPKKESTTYAQRSREVGSLYIVYHDWEHYSSARNINGPHSGPPNIIEVSRASKATDH